MTTSYTRGTVMLLVIVFGAIFFVVLTAMSGFVLAQNRAQDATRTKSESFTVAEAGLEYYRWFLSHFPGNTTNGTGQPGPYVATYNDPENGTAGTYTLSIVGNGSCGVTQSIDVTSKGVANDTPASSVTLVGRYAAPSVASYSYIVGSSVWAGPDRIINGPYHSNGGIRMDGTPNAPVSSSLTTWTCDNNFNCIPTITAPGVVGTGANPNLWENGTPQVDFGAIASNFPALKTKAVASGLYFARVSTSSGGNPKPHLGYHLIFNANGTVTVKKVTAVTSTPLIKPINPADTVTDYTLISTETVVGTYAVPAQCGLIFVEDNTWVEGTVTQKVTLAAAGVIDSSFKPDVVIRNNTVYSAYDGSVGLTIISSHNILISADSPNTMTINGILVAQSGVVGRNLYTCGSAYEPRSTLTILGTTVSNLRTGTRWQNACASPNPVDSGYQVRIDAFDRQNTTSPPPYTPTVSTQWQFVDWKQL